MSFANEVVRRLVADRLHDDPRLDASRVRVEAERGVVTLEGTVETHRASVFAREDAAAVSLVTEVVNRLEVICAGDASLSDEAVGRCIREALAKRRNLRVADFVLAVAGGVVFIDGFVETLRTKREVEDIAVRQGGVAEVRNNITVVPPQRRPDSEIAGEIAGLVRKKPDGGGVRASIDRGVVTLSGAVPTGIVRRRVVEAVAAVSGVLEIRDRLSIGPRPSERS